MYLLLLVIVLVLLFGGLPQMTGHWHGYGYMPSGIVFIIFIVLIVLVFSGRL